MSTTEVPHVYAAICDVIKLMSQEGIGKNRKNAQQGYSFRGIDDVYNALAPMLASVGLCVLPRVISRTVTEQQSKAGGMLFYVVLEVEYDFVSAKDGSIHTCRSVGEAMDSGDKATNKAMSAAFKYAAMQAFCIPTEGDNDTENQTHQVVRSVKTDPRPDTSGVDPAAVSSYLKAFRDAMADRSNERILKIHHDLQGEHEVYSAVGDGLTTKEKNVIKDAVAAAREDAGKARM